MSSWILAAMAAAADAEKKYGSDAHITVSAIDPDTVGTPAEGDIWFDIS